MASLLPSDLYSGVQTAVGDPLESARRRQLLAGMKIDDRKKEIELGQLLRFLTEAQGLGTTEEMTPPPAPPAFQDSLAPGGAAGVDQLRLRLGGQPPPPPAPAMPETDPRAELRRILMVGARTGQVAPQTALQALEEDKQRSPANVQEYEYAKQSGYTGSFADWMKEGAGKSQGAAGQIVTLTDGTLARVARATDGSETLTPILDPTTGKPARALVQPQAGQQIESGGLVYTLPPGSTVARPVTSPPVGPGQPGQPLKAPTAGKAPTDAQAAAAGYGRRLEQAMGDMERLVEHGFHRESYGFGAQSLLPSGLQSEALQQQEQAERNFINANLRRESGASIQRSEFKSAEKQYFPRAGDKPETLAQKARGRAQALANLKAAAGPSWDLTPAIGGAGGAPVKWTRDAQGRLVKEQP